MEPLGAGDPRAVGPYRLTCRLGAGGMGRVFLGESPAGRRVAVKLVREDLASSAGFRERFRREAKLAMRAGGFWAAQVVDADPDAAVPWIASQYIDGPSLAERVARHGPLDEDEVRRLGLGLAEALASFHKAGLVHRDLKPSNVLLLDDGPRVIDFGISKALVPLETSGGADLTRTGTILGTPGFMAPEQALGQPAGPPADVFSLGSLLVHAATGAGPFGDGPSHALLFRVVYEACELGAVPPGLRGLAEDCLRKAPGERPAAETLVTRLAELRPTAVPDPRVTAGTATDVATGAATDVGSRPDAPADTGPGRGTSPTRGGPAAAAPAAAGTDGFAVAEWGPAAFRRRMRRPVMFALGIDVLFVFLGLAFGRLPVMLGYAFAVTLLCLLYGLKVSLPLRGVRAVRVGPEGLFVQQGSHRLTVPWRDIAAVGFARMKNKRGLALTATLEKGARIRLPRRLRGAEGMLACRVAPPVGKDASGWKGWKGWKGARKSKDSKGSKDANARAQDLETALRSYAGARYRAPR